MRRFFLFLLLLGLTQMYYLGAQTVTEPLDSALYASGAGGNASDESPMAIRFNPAVTALQQRTGLELGYLQLFGQGSSGVNGDLNLGGTLPTKWGVFSAAGSYLAADFKDRFQVGNLGRLTFGASKPIFEDLCFGAAIDGSFGSHDWGAGLTLGLYQQMGDWWYLKDLRWGLSFRDIGKGNWTGYDASVPPPFTPAAGIEFTPLKMKDLAIGVRTDLSLPSFQDLNWNLGTTVSLFDFCSLNLGYAFDLRDYKEDRNPRWPLSIGLNFKFTTDIQDKALAAQGLSHNDVSINTVAAPIAKDVWAAGGSVNVKLGVVDKNPPNVKAAAEKRYISPNNDGVKDNLEVPVSITDERYVMGYSFVISDPAGKVIRTIQNKETRPQDPNFDSVVKNLLYEKKGVPVPPVLVWNGVADSGKPAAEGNYTVSLKAWDDNNNIKTVDLGSVVVKITPPQASANAPLSEFNPIGPRSSLLINQSGSVEDHWVGNFSDASGKLLRTYTWDNSTPPSFSWDGKNKDNQILPDGVYRYALSAVDRAGNKTSVKVDNLIVNSIPTPVGLDVNRSAFSPEGTGVKTIILQPKPSVPNGIVSWSLGIKNAQGQVVRTLKGDGVVPAQVSFDGRSDLGNGLPEGSYKALLTLEYTNGNRPQADSPEFIIRNTPPQAKIEAPFTVFSPGSDDGRDAVSVKQTSSKEEVWNAQFVNEAGKVVKTVHWSGSADPSFVWDGRDADGKILPDGKYNYHLEAEDKAGNKGQSNVMTLVIDTQKRSVLLSTDHTAFSPILPGNDGKLKFLSQVKGAEALVSWTLSVKDDKDQTVKIFQGKAYEPTIDWNGLNDKGERVADGNYSAQLKTAFQNGSEPSARTKFLIKTSAPTASLEPVNLMFSLSASSKKTSAIIKQTTSSESEWSGQIADAAGSKIKTWSWKGKAPDMVWDGTDDKGNKVDDGIYSYTIQSMDEAGNKTVQNVKNIVLDSRPTPIFLTVSSDGFSPNGDSVEDSITLNPKLILSEGVKEWSLDLVEATKGHERTFTGTGPIPAQFVWDGKTDQGSAAPDGSYVGVLKVVYLKGDEPQTKSSSFVLQASGPQLSIGLTPLPFSPDNDGTADELSISLGVKTYAGVDNWQLEVLDPEGHHFTAFTGKGSPTGLLTWDGRSDTGELVQSATDYTMVFSLKDALGNSAQVKKTLPVDVLVIKDGDKLRIIIPSINFAKNKADFLNLDADTLARTPDAVAKNISVLKRLAEIFAKYGHYKIIIEGHAVMENWNDAARGKKEQDQELLPLSKKRAESVKSYLADLGISSGRISTVGVGGARPVVPFSDMDNRWKDRRVEFILVKE